MIDRIKGVFRLDPDTFESIEHDPAATGEAARIVGAVGVLNGIGNAVSAGMDDGSVIGAFLGGIVAAYGGWLLWSGVTYVIGTKLFDAQATPAEMLRVLGYASAPQLLGIIPCLGVLVGGIWSLIAGFIAARQGLDLDNARTFFTIAIGFAGYVALAIAVGIVMGTLGLFGIG